MCATSLGGLFTIYDSMTSCSSVSPPACVSRARWSVYTHIIDIGGKEHDAVLSAFTRHTTGGVEYVDPVVFENVLEMVNGIPYPTFEPFIRVRSSAHFQ